MGYNVLKVRFELSSPQIRPAESVRPDQFTACRTFEPEERPLAVWLQLERAA